MSKTNPNIPQSQSKIVPPYIPPPKPTVRTIPLHIADAAVAACEKEIQELRAEVERLRAASFVTAVPVEQYERVIKAGDALAEMVGYHVPYEDQKELEKAWLAAKEGKQP